MRVVDKRFTLLGEVFGHEAIVLSKREREALRRASEVLDAVRERRSREYHERGLAETLGLAEDVADDSDGLLLATAASYLSEIVSEIFPTGEIVSLPPRVPKR